MRAKVAITVFALALGLDPVSGVKASGTSASESSGAAQRRASVMRAQAAALRERADHLRGQGAEHPSPAKARQLEKRADSIEADADRIDPQDWPPSD